MAAERPIGVAIAIPDPYGAELQRWRESFGDPMAHAIPTHITLLPPTAVNTGPAAIDGHLRRIARAGRGFSIRLSGTGSFRPVSPVVFVTVADGFDDCVRVARAVRAGPLARELPFPYHPHVTVAHDLPEETLDRAYKDLADYEAEFSVTGFSLYEHGADGVWRPRRAFTFD